MKWKEQGKTALYVIRASTMAYCIFECYAAVEYNAWSLNEMHTSVYTLSLYNHVDTHSLLTTAAAAATTTIVKSLRTKRFFTCNVIDSDYTVGKDVGGGALLHTLLRGTKVYTCMRYFRSTYYHLEMVWRFVSLYHPALRFHSFFRRENTQGREELKGK